MRTIRVSEKEYGVLMILRGMGADVVEVMELGREALRRGHGSARRARRCMEKGAEELRREAHTVSFARAVEAALERRQGRRARTVGDFRYMTRRFMKRCPGLAQRRVRGVRAQECAEWIAKAFDTAAQRTKARAALSGVFAEACRQGWCAENPVLRVPKPRVQERQVQILSNEEMQRLLQVAAEQWGGSCLAAVGMMLYAGIRPHEVARLSWADVHEAEGVISIQPRHSKTGGARLVTIQAPLAELLQRVARPGESERVCPANWLRRWAELRRAAGWHPCSTPWQPDALRHTFASHHLATYRSYAELQLEMGHRSAELLRTRYVSMPRGGATMFGRVAAGGGLRAQGERG